MHLQSKLQKKLKKIFADDVRVSIENNVATLTGNVSQWHEFVKAGRLCADKKCRWTVVNDIVCEEALQKEQATTPAFDSSLEGMTPDVVIIGGGVIGCAIARELTKWKLSVMLLEKEHDVAMHASGRNDGMVHPGIDLHKGQVKQAYNAKGNAMYDKLCNELSVKFKRTGQLLCFDKPWMKFVLKLSLVYWKCLGIPCHYVNKKSLQSLEPMLNSNFCCALLFPSAGIVCPYGLTIGYAENAVQNGAHFCLDTQVMDIRQENGVIKAITTNKGTVCPKLVINAAGVFCEDIAKMAGDRFYSIHPRKGTNSILDKKAAHQVRTIASAMGTTATKTAHSKGGGVVSTIDGNLLIGPDAHETWEKENFETNVQSINAVFAKQKKAVPTLSQTDIITYFTGVRSATYEEDFVIEAGRKAKNLIHAAGIQSPGLTAAPAIGVDVANMAVKMLLQKGEAVVQNSKFNPCREAIPKPTEMSETSRDEFIRQNPDFGIIICRCEEVSRGEIIAALHRPVPCDTIDAVKRRVRPGMGRCQGGFCGPLVAQIISQQLNIPLHKIKKSGIGSNILLKPTKEVCNDEQPSNL